MQIITRLNEILTQKGISVLKFSKETDIPEGRVYKWLDEKKPANPKFEDVAKIEAWLKKHSFRQGANPDPLYSTPTHSDRQAMRVAAPLEDQHSPSSLVRTVEIQAEVIKKLLDENESLKASLSEK